jgi:4-amino-4-deoxy-L-arabinose transferase-like glycosyltransferase
MSTVAPATGRRTWAPRIDGALITAVIAIVLGTVARLVMITTNIARFESDEAVTGIMAQRILDGDFPAYFGIQSYQGALEQYLQAAVFAVFPDTPLALRSVQLVLTIVIAALVFVLGTRIVGSRWAGALATALYALGPYYSVIKGVRSHGGYDGALIFGLLAVLLALRLRRDTDRAPWVAAGIGLCAGIAMWENYLAVYLLVPAVLWALGSARGSLQRLMPWGIGGLVVGLAPAIAFRLGNGLNPPSGTGTPPPTSFSERMDLLFSPVLGKFLGVPSPEPWVARVLPAALVLFIALGALGAAVWVRRRGIWHTITLRTTERRPIDIVLIAFIIMPFIYAASSYTWFAGEPRYLFTLYPFLAIGIAAAVFTLPLRMRMVVGIGVVIISATLLVTNMRVVHAAGGEISAADGGVVYTEDLPAVVDVLEARGADTAYADYWVANPLQFFAGERLSVASTSVDHFPSVSAEVDRDADPAIVSTAPGGADAMRATLTQSGRTFTETPAGRFVVFSDIRPPWRRPNAG